MDQWGDYFKQCQLIFYRATSGNKKVLFGSKGSVIEKDDERLRTIPFQTRRATFKEVKQLNAMIKRAIEGNYSVRYSRIPDRKWFLSVFVDASLKGLPEKIESAYG